MSITKPLPSSAKHVFSGKIFDVYQWEQTLFDGSTATFERLKRVNTAGVIAVVGDKILVLEQEQPDLLPYVGVPGGRCDSYEESELDAAKRELFEETGYTSQDWRDWKHFEPFTKMVWDIGVFIARDCKKTGEPHLDAGEKITPKLITLDEFIELGEQDNFRDVELISELLRMKLHPERKEAFKKLLFE